VGVRTSHRNLLPHAIRTHPLVHTKHDPNSTIDVCYSIRNIEATLCNVHQRSLKCWFKPFFGYLPGKNEIESRRGRGGALMDDQTRANSPTEDETLAMAQRVSLRVVIPVVSVPFWCILNKYTALQISFAGHGKSR